MDEGEVVPSRIALLLVNDPGVLNAIILWVDGLPVLPREKLFKAENRLVFSFLKNLLMKVRDVEVSICAVVSVAKLVKGMLDRVSLRLWLKGIESLVLLPWKHAIHLNRLCLAIKLGIHFWEHIVGLCRLIRLAGHGTTQLEAARSEMICGPKWCLCQGILLDDAMIPLQRCPIQGYRADLSCWGHYPRSFRRLWGSYLRWQNSNLWTVVVILLHNHMVIRRYWNVLISEILAFSEKQDAICGLIAFGVTFMSITRMQIRYRRIRERILA